MDTSVIGMLRFPFVRSRDDYHENAYEQGDEISYSKSFESLQQMRLPMEKPSNRKAEAVHKNDRDVRPERPVGGVDSPLSHEPHKDDCRDGAIENAKSGLYSIRERFIQSFTKGSRLVEDLYEKVSYWQSNHIDEEQIIEKPQVRPGKWRSALIEQAEHAS